MSDGIDAQNYLVRRATEGDLARIAAINAQVFNGNKDNIEAAKEWVRCWFCAFPLYQYFVIECGGEVAGYVGWEVKGGFKRPAPVVELEQLGIDPQFQKRGLASLLTEESLRTLVLWIGSTNNRIESHIHVVVWAYALNFNAQKVYAGTFTDGVKGFREQFGDRGETMLRLRMPLIRAERNGA
jgi:GNAT superfamily N-acetyltransferase